MVTEKFSVEDIKRQIRRIETQLGVRETECHNLRLQRTALRLAIDLLEGPDATTPTSAR